MLPWWKIRRELNRLAVQAQSIPALIYEPFLQKNSTTRNIHLPLTISLFILNNSITVHRLIYYLELPSDLVKGEIL